MKHLAAKTAKVASVVWPSETIFKTDLTVDNLFGLPRSVSAGGLAMDADRLASVTTPLDGDQQKKINFLLQTGMMSSALEHSVPEQLFSTPENPAEGVSAVKALQIANEQGIPIYTVTKTNLATVLPQLQLDAQVKADIQNAVNAGKVVTVSKTDINFHGWVGCGYVISDPTTGAGAYMIGGGLSGGFGLWSIFDTIFETLGQFAKHMEKSVEWRRGLKVFKSLGRALGIFGIGVQTILDMKSLEKSDDLTEWLLALSTILISNSVMVAAIFLAGPAGFFTALIANVLLAVAVNFIKNFFLFLILDNEVVRSRRKDLDYV